MPRKQQGNLKIMIDAVARIKRVRENDDGQNPEFSQALDIAEKYLLDKLYAKARDTIKLIDVLARSNDGQYVAYEVTLHFENIISNSFIFKY